MGHGTDWPRWPSANYHNILLPQNTKNGMPGSEFCPNTHPASHLVPNVLGFPAGYVYTEANLALYNKDLN